MTTTLEKTFQINILFEDYPIEMDLEKTVLQCMLCPGYCSFKCPVYKSSYHRASAPVNIARALYKYIKWSKREYLLNTGYCSLCGKCEEVCPVNNPLPSAISRLRRELTVSVNSLYREDAEAIDIIVPNDISIDEDVLVDFDLNNVNIVYSDELYHDIVFGYNSRIRISNGYNEDVDVFLNRYSIELISNLRIRANISEYILHIPCKLNEKYAESFSTVFGEPKKIIYGCMGGGGIDLIAPNLIKKMLTNYYDLRYPVISQCGRAVRILRRNGIEAYTPLEVITHWMR